jgi:four helix bundle protein
MEIWQKSKFLAKEIYEITSIGPFSKDWALKDRIRRASISIPCNIAEGFERGGNKEFIQFLSYAKGSAGEVFTQLHIAFELGYLSKEDFSRLEEQVTKISHMLGGFMKYLKRSSQKGSKYKPF